MQTQDQLAPHLETLTRALGNKIGTEVTEDDLKDEFAKYIEYGVPVDQAIKTILRHHGVQSTTTSPAAPSAAPVSQDPVAIKDLPGQSPWVRVKARFLTVNTKNVNARGEDKEIYWGLLGDATGSVSYTSWAPLEGVEKGDAYDIAGAYTKEWNGQAQINFGDRTQMQKLDPSEVPTTPESFNEVKVADIQDGMRGLAVEGRILNVAPRDINLKTGETKTLWSGKLADESGAIEFTSWHDHGLEDGQAIRIEGAYVRSFRGAPQLNFDSDAKNDKPEAQLPKADDLAATTSVDLETLIQRGGGNDVTLVGTLLEVRPGSGLIFRDKETNRVVHGAQQSEGTPDLRIKAILDDGTGAVNMIIGRPLTEELLGKNLEQCQAEVKEAFRQEVIQEQLQDKLTGRVFTVTGNALSDDYGIMLLVQSIKPSGFDVQQKASELLESLEAN